MVVYADLMFLLNGALDGLLLWLTATLRRHPVVWYRVLGAALLGGCYAIFPLWFTTEWVEGVAGKLCISLVMVRIAFGPMRWRQYSSFLGIFYIVCFLAGGLLMALQEEISEGAFVNHQSPLWMWLIVALAFPAVGLYSRWSYARLRETHQLQPWLFPLRVTMGQATVTCTALFDTGNRLRDPFVGTPVILMERLVWRGQLPAALRELESGPEPRATVGDTFVRWIPYRAVGHEAHWLPAFLPDKVSLYREGSWHKVAPMFIGIARGQLAADRAYQAILPPAVLGEMTKETQAQSSA